MIEYYAEIRLAHVASALASGTLFLLRGLLVTAGRGDRALARPARYASYAIDTALLAAAILLLTILPQSAFSNGWLYAKLALLPVYIGLGWLALRSAPRGVRQLACLAGALAAFLGMYVIARAHDPLGLLNGG
ncbi:MAG: SirB2 family protein [Gammaproteobacteria bacterium]